MDPFTMFDAAYAAGSAVASVAEAVGGVEAATNALEFGAAAVGFATACNDYENSKTSSGKGQKKK